MYSNLDRLLHLLQTNVEAIDACYSHTGFKYSSTEELILKHGATYIDINKKSRLKGIPQNCYQNCYDIMLRRPDLTYCEGYATTSKIPIAVVHAWLVDSERQVIDPTWGRRNDPVYIGITFERDYVINFVNTHKLQGILESYYLRQKMMDIEEILNGAVQHP